MSLFGTVSSPTTGVCVLIFQPQDAVHVHVAGLLPILMPPLSLCFSLTYMHKPTSTAGSQHMKAWKVSKCTNKFCEGREKKQRTARRLWTWLLELD